MKARIQSIIDRIFPMGASLPAGISEYRSNTTAGTPYRLHLRVEPSGEGILILNAKTVLHLNDTATEYAYGIVHGCSNAEMMKRMRGRYRISRSQVEKDFSDFSQRLDTLIHTPDLSPDIFLDFDRIAPHSSSMSAPLRIDCALTYRIPSRHEKGTTPMERVARELSNDEWKSILRKSWNAGVPHVVFTGGEPSLRPDLPELIAEAENLGMVSGLLTSGYRLSEKDYLHTLLQKGLDHVMVSLDPADETAWEALRDLVPEDIFVTVHLTLSKRMKADSVQVLERLSKLGIKSISLSAESSTFKDELARLQNLAANLGLSMVWDLPVPYSNLNPISCEEVEANEKHAGAGRSWIYIEPDGDVLPEQGRNNVVGNILTGEWPDILENLKKL